MSTFSRSAVGSRNQAQARARGAALAGAAASAMRTPATAAASAARVPADTRVAATRSEASSFGDALSNIASLLYAARRERGFATHRPPPGARGHAPPDPRGG